MTSNAATGAEALQGEKTAPNSANNSTRTQTNSLVCCNPNTGFHQGGGQKPANCISILTGASVRYEADLRVPCPLIDLELDRQYVNSIKYNGPMGAVWCHSYDWKLEWVGPSAVAVHALCDPNAAPHSGMSHTFNPMLGEETASLNGTGYRLKWEGTNFKLCLPNGRLYVFNSAGRLERIEHPAGQWVSLALPIKLTP